MMPFVSASGQILTTVFVISVVEAKYRRWANSTYKTPAESFPQRNYLFYRPIAVIDTDVFYSWSLNFFKKTENLRRNNRELLLIMDLYAAHMKLKKLKLLRNNNVLFIVIPSHTSHVLQPLDISVFGSLKE